MSERLISELQERYGHEEYRVAVAPGRVNLIGEHTDYNEGFVLPAAIDRSVTIVFSPNPYGELRGYALDFDEERSVSYEQLEPPRGEVSWFDYPSGTAWVLRRDGLSLSGLDFVLAGDIPPGAGLSSSAAVELAVSRALYSVSGLPWDPQGAALAGQSVENDYLGLESGIMDQMISALGLESTAMLLDCRDLSFKRIPIPSVLAIVVIDTGTRRSVVTSAYNERREQCQQAVRAIRQRHPEVLALRDVSVTDLGGTASLIDDETYRRALHVVSENQRVLEMAQALSKGDLARVGRLMSASHESLRHLYEVSTDELDACVEAAKAHPACCGARMTGAGFGGSAVALVRRAALSSFIEDLSRVIPAPATVFACETSGGARLVG